MVWKTNNKFISNNYFLWQVEFEIELQKIINDLSAPRWRDICWILDSAEYNLTQNNSASLVNFELRDESITCTYTVQVWFD